MKKAIITTGGKQYVVREGETLNVDLLKDAKKSVDFKPLLTIDDAKVSIGTPVLDSAVVSAEVITPMLKADKVTAIRYKAKKRVHKVHGHRQQHTEIKITKIA